MDIKAHELVIRKIKFKPANSSEFINYVDIGSCDRDYHSVNFFLTGNHETSSGKLYFESYTSWYENLLNESIGSKMIIMNYYLSEFMGWNLSENTPQIEYFEDIYGEKTLRVISDNLNYLLGFNDKWFDFQSSIFKGLDLDWEDVEGTFTHTNESVDGLIDEIEFNDGSTIKFLDDDDSVKSFYIPEAGYPNLKIDIDAIVLMFKP